MSNFINTKWAEYSGELVPLYNAKRFDNGADRFYWFVNENKDKIPAAGITSWLGKVMAESPFITEWKIKWGSQWKTVLDITSAYGTLLHTAFAHMMIHNTHPPQEMIDMGKGIIRELKRFDKTLSEEMIDKNLVCFQRFREEYNLKPLLIEAILTCRAHTGDYYCLTEDLLAEITYEKKTKTEIADGVFSKGKDVGKPRFKTETTVEKVTEIICLDFKSNPFDKDKKSFYDAHLYQLIGTAKAVQQNFGIKVDRLYNWSPNNWRTDVGDYTLHEWKPTPLNYEIFELYERLASKTGAFTPKGNINVFKPWTPEIKSSDMFTQFAYMDYIEYLEKKEETA